MYVTTIVGTTALKKKGLRRVQPEVVPHIHVGTTALKKKGLRHRGAVQSLHIGPVGTTALKKKGLRLAAPAAVAAGRCWNYCPEEEGIKTRSRLRR